jgi:hypothetical protein
MSSLRLLLLNLWHHGRIHVTVALGVAVATAVLTGALLMGGWFWTGLLRPGFL